MPAGNAVRLTPRKRTLSCTGRTSVKPSPSISSRSQGWQKRGTAFGSSRLARGSKWSECGWETITASAPATASSGVQGSSTRGLGEAPVKEGLEKRGARYGSQSQDTPP